MIEYREAKIAEDERLAKLAMESFGDYPFYSFALKDSFRSDRDYRAYMEKLNLIELRANMRGQKCFVGTVDGEIVSAALLQDPQKPKIGIWQYLRSGAGKLIFPVGLGRILDFFSMTEEARSDCEKQCTDSWYLDMLVVNGSMKGRSLGSRMLQECVLPYVRAHGGKSLSLITNTDGNRRFYARNGFSEFAERKLTRCGNSIMNWSFVHAL